jgi:hypothetical protein
LEKAKTNRSFSTWIVQRRNILAGIVLALIIGLGIGYGLWHSSNSSPFHSALYQCPAPNTGGDCPYEFTFLSGQVNVTEGLPSFILFWGSGYTPSAGIFCENAHCSYELYIPINYAEYGGTVTTVNGTTYPSGTPFPILYHVTIQYYLTNSTIRTCTPQPNNITFALSQNQQQSFSC